MRKSREQLPDNFVDKQQQRQQLQLAANFLASIKSKLVAKLKGPLLSDSAAHLKNGGGKLQFSKQQSLPANGQDEWLTIEGDLNLNINNKEVKNGTRGAKGDIEDNRNNDNEYRTIQKSKFGSKSANSCAIKSKKEKFINGGENSVRPREAALPQSTPTLTHHGHHHIVVPLSNIDTWPTSIILIFLSFLVLLLIMMALFAQQEQNSLPRELSKQNQQSYLCFLGKKYHNSLIRQAREQNEDQNRERKQIFLRENNKNSDHSPLNNPPPSKIHNSTNDAFILAPSARYVDQSHQAYHLDMVIPDTCSNRAVKLKGGAKLSSVKPDPDPIVVVDFEARTKVKTNAQRFIYCPFNSTSPKPPSNHQHLIPLPDFSRELSKTEAWQRQCQIVKQPQKQRHYLGKLKNHYYLYYHSCDISINYTRILETPPRGGKIARIIPTLPGDSSLASLPCQCKLRDNDLELLNGRSLSKKTMFATMWPCQKHSSGEEAKQERVFRDAELSHERVKMSITASSSPKIISTNGGSYFLFAKAEQIHSGNSPTTNKGIIHFRPKRRAADPALATGNNRNRLIVRRHRRRRHTPRHISNLSIIKQTVPSKSRYLILFGLAEHHSSLSGLSAGSDKGDAASQVVEQQFSGRRPRRLEFYKQNKINLFQNDQSSGESVLDESSTIPVQNDEEKEAVDSNEASNSGGDDDNIEGDKQSNNVSKTTTFSLLETNNITTTVLKDGINITISINGKNNNTNSSEENNQCEEPDQVKDLISSVFLTIAFAFFYFIIFIIGFLGNTLTLLAMRRKREKISTMDIFISNLACSDIMLCIVAVVMTPIYLLYHKYWNFGSFMCKAVAFAQGASVYISTLTLISIAYVRYQLIVHPLGIPMKFCTAILLNCLIWIISFSINVPYLMHMNLLPEKCTIKFCVESWEGDNDRFRFSLITITVQFFLPFFLVSFFYSSISRKLREQKELRDNQHKSERQKYENHREIPISNQIQSNNEHERRQEKIGLGGGKKVLELANNKVIEKRRSSSSDMVKTKTMQNNSGSDGVKQLVSRSKVNNRAIHQEKRQVDMNNFDITSGSSRQNNTDNEGKKVGKRRFGLFSHQKSLAPNCGPKQNVPATTATTTTTTTTTVSAVSEKGADKKEKANEIELVESDHEISASKQNESVEGEEEGPSKEIREFDMVIARQRFEEEGSVLQDEKKELDNVEESTLKVIPRATINNSVTLPQISIVTDGEINHLQHDQVNEVLNNASTKITAQAEQIEEAGLTLGTLTTTASQKAATLIKIRPSESLIELSTSIYNESDNLPCGISTNIDHSFVGTVNNCFTDISSSCSCSNLRSSDIQKQTSTCYNNTSSQSDKDNHQREEPGNKSRRSMRHNLLQTLQQTFKLKQKRSSSKTRDHINTNVNSSTTFSTVLLGDNKTTNSKSKKGAQNSQVSKFKHKVRRRSAEQVAHLSGSRIDQNNFDLRQERSCVLADSTINSTNYLGQPTGAINASSSSHNRQQQKMNSARGKQVGSNKYNFMNATNADILALKEQRQRERDERLRQTNRKLLWMVIMFVVAWLPLNLFNLIQDYSETVSNSPYTNHVFLIVHLFASSSVCYNPILYAWMSDNYRQELRDILPVFILKHFTCLLGEA